MAIQSSSTEIMAYTSRVARSFHKNKRLLQDNSMNNNMNRGGDARGRSSGINMAMDSRELRFYASASSRPSPGSKQHLNTDIFNPLTTPLLSYVDEKVPAGGNRKLLEVGNPVSFSIYSNGIGGLMNTFDSERKLSYAYAGAAGTARYSSFVSFTSHFFNITKDSVGTETRTDMSSRPSPPGQDANTIPIDLTEQEQELFDLLRTVTKECGMKSTLRVAGGWVRDKILATKEFKQNRLSLDLLSDGDRPNGENEAMNRITSKFKGERGCKFFVTVNHLLLLFIPTHSYHIF